MSAALEYHRATDVPATGSDEDEARRLETHPTLFKDYGDAKRVPIESSVAGPILRDGAAVVGSATHFGWPGERKVHFRAYSSAGALYPVEAYVASAEGLFSFDALERALVRIAGGDTRAHVAAAAAAPELARAEAVVVLTGIHGRTGWKYHERGYRHIWWDAGTMLTNLLALAAAQGLAPRLYTAFVDEALNQIVGADGRAEYALALLALGGAGPVASNGAPVATATLPPEQGRGFPLAERLHAASSFASAEEARSWRVDAAGEEPVQPYASLVDAMRRRRSVRTYSPESLPFEEVRRVLAWSEGPIPADAPAVVRQLVTVAAVEGLEPGIYDARLTLIRALDEQELRERSSFAAMEQDHPRLAAFNVWQMADLPAVVERLGDRGYRWAQLEAGIRAGRLQIGAFMRGWGAAASTFYDEEVSRLLEASEAPMLMVAIGAR